MRGKKLVQLPINFKYSDAGAFKEDCAVTISAPALDQFKVHSKMMAFASEAETNLAIKFASVERPKSDAPEPEKEEQKEETDEEMADRVLGIYAMGLGTEKFPEFMEYVKAVLTGNSKLASVGDTNIPLRAESWDSIDLEGGLEAVSLLIATFAGFFLGQPVGKSEGTNGSNSPPSQRSDRAVH